MRDKIKTACILRVGGIGDVAITTPLLPILKQEGYEVTYISRWHTQPVLLNNPYIDKWKKWRWSIEHNQKLLDRLEAVKGQYDKFINMSASIEGALLAREGTKEAELPKSERHSRYNVNYYEYAFTHAGCQEHAPEKILPQIFLSKAEEKAGKNLRKTIGGKVIMWVLSGSGFYKTWPMAEASIIELLDEHEDLKIITVGDAVCHMIEPRHERALNRSGIWNLRRSIIMSKYVDLVVSTDTGIAHIAAAHSTPMVMLLSNVSQENITKHWDNTTVIESDAKCHPCHRQIYSRDYCMRDDYWNSPICMSKISKDVVKDAVKEKLYGNSNSTDSSVISG